MCCIGAKMMYWCAQHHQAAVSMKTLETQFLVAAQL
jgi:hypothetical protein